MYDIANCQLEGAKLVYTYIHGIYRGFNRQKFESRGRLEDEGTKRTTTQVSKMIEKVPETGTHLKLDEEQWRATTEEEREAGGQRTHVYLSKYYHSSAP